MLTKLLTYKSGIVITLIIALSSVYACQVLCDFNNYNISSTGHLSFSSNSNLYQSDHSENHSFSSHQHDLENDHEHHNDNINDHEQQSGNHSSRQDDCCEEKITSVFNSLSTQKIGIPSLEAKLFLVFEIELSAFQATYNNLITKNFEFYSDSSPPIKGVSVFLLVQSFLL